MCESTIKIVTIIKTDHYFKKRFKSIMSNYPQNFFLAKNYSIMGSFTGEKFLKIQLYAIIGPYHKVAGERFSQSFFKSL